MHEQDQGRPLAGEALAGQVWMPVKHAARAAGVPERSAFRWAKKGAVEVRRSGKVQLVEVAALAAYAARPVNARVAGVGAGSQPNAEVAVIRAGIPGFGPASSATVAEVAALADWDERLCALEVFIEECEARLQSLERAETGRV